MAAQDPNEAPEGVEDPRLASLDAQLKAAHRAEAERINEAKGSSGMSNKGVVLGNRVASIMLGYPLGAGIIGWLVDGWLGARPWVMLVLLFLGFAAACLEVFRSANKHSD
jgi:ATP synthase protein I